MAQSFDREREFAVLLEDVRSEVRMVAEGLVSFDQKFERRFEALEHKMDTGFMDVRTAIAATNRRLDETAKQLNGRLNEATQQLNGRLDQLVTRFDTHERTRTNC